MKIMLLQTIKIAFTFRNGDGSSMTYQTKICIPLRCRHRLEFCKELFYKKKDRNIMYLCKRDKVCLIRGCREVWRAPRDIEHVLA